MAQLPDSIDFALKIWAAIAVPGSLIAAIWKPTQARTYAARIELTVSGEILPATSRLVRKTLLFG